MAAWMRALVAGGGLLVPVEEDRRPCQVLGDLPVPGVFGGFGQTRVVPGVSGEYLHSGGGKGIRDVDAVPVE